MADLVANTSFGVGLQSAPGSFATLSSTDRIPVANMRVGIPEITAASTEYTGSVHKPGDIYMGKYHEVSFDIPLRGPGGTMPAANAFILGRILQAAGFTENRISSAIPASPEAAAAATTTTVTLGATATGTADLYKGLLVFLSAAGTAANLKAYSAIRGNTAGKVATLCETFAVAPTGNYQIPKQLAYQLSASGSLPALTTNVWRGGKRYDGVDMAVTRLVLNFPTNNKNNTSFPFVSVTLTGELYASADEAAPYVTPLGAIPSFQDGDFWLHNKALGGSSVVIDMGAEGANPDNANKSAGMDPAQLTGTKRTSAISLNQVATSVFDPIATADAQGYGAMWGQYGKVIGNQVAFIICNQRTGYPQDSGDGSPFVQWDLTGQMDAADKEVNIVFPIL